MPGDNQPGNRPSARELLDGARLIAAALLAGRNNDPHTTAHLVLELERELLEALVCRPPDGSYRTEELTCSYGWQRRPSPRAPSEDAAP